MPSKYERRNITPVQFLFLVYKIAVFLIKNHELYLSFLKIK